MISRIGAVGHTEKRVDVLLFVPTVNHDV